MDVVAAVQTHRMGDGIGVVDAAVDVGIGEGVAVSRFHGHIVGELHRRAHAQQTAVGSAKVTAR